MKLHWESKAPVDNFLKAFRCFILIALVISSVFGTPNRVLANNQTNGERLFIENCAGCHINGGNIIRRSKTLRLKDLHRNGLDNADAIAKIAKEGIGIMSGYKDVLGENGDNLVANWIWEQSQKAWVQG
ncbi:MULTISPECIES: c-type cytochrome [Prochlorococcus]|uniref:Cytochrome C n=1 Tax=Prochlorococcus marinus (strain SARG / CCMP1375 / SS120) TaxID=167539 RepID=Q7VD12_PROMA|nr:MULTISPECIES: c-type cytochrome [Prochlorococcus]AAP99622.1 Cytochrome C [Prochlorococcus marinus subsp. marinus str. CCMP1375]KGG21446.1 Cytochrome C553 (soluble cytochrome f) [Prochlorococcus marinus str. SS2]KGG23209.1 Cytochrome C553 (soluble cytochrome f) [Prochlorococcus marinus str. SS35]KGG33920.1 Cytochrome C553 (soluble cytochrome f) [Prochlorococcus marinus str. SS51]